jgi:hypothetical protein
MAVHHHRARERLLTIMIHSKVKKMVIGLKESGLTLYKWIKLHIWGKVYLEDRWHEKWKTNVPYYLVNCPKDGLFEDYPHMRGYLECPECGRHFYPFEYFWGVWNQYPWPDKEVTPWPKGVR